MILSDNSIVTNVALWSLVPFTVAFVFIVFVFYRSRREAQLKQKESELKQQMAEVEMKALRAQMNPHFIFNCLNSIYFFIRQNEGTKAGQYLIKFSNLMRMVLENSLHKSVPLAEDIKALDLYIQMECMRMNNRFDYAFEIAGDIDAARVQVPPLIMQPFVENSIWHGLNGKKDQGHLLVKVEHADGMLKISVEDDGTETAQPKEERLAEGIVKKKSLGTGITGERLDILNKTGNTNSYFKLSDRRDDNNQYLGKRLELFLPFVMAEPVVEDDLKSKIVK